MSNLEFENLKNSVPAQPIFKKDSEEPELFILEPDISPYSKKIEELISVLQNFTPKSKSEIKFESAKRFDRAAVKYGIDEALKIIKTMVSKEELEQASYLIRFYSNGEMVDSAKRRFFKNFIACIFEQFDKINHPQEKSSDLATHVHVVDQDNLGQSENIEMPNERISFELEDIAKAFKMRSKGNVKGKSPYHMTKTFEVEKGINDTLNRMKQNGEIIEYEFINIAIRFMIAQFYPEYTKDLKPLDDLNYKTLVKLQNNE